MKELSNLNKLKVAINRKQRAPVKEPTPLRSALFDLYCTLEDKDTTNLLFLRKLYRKAFGDFFEVINTGFMPYNNHYSTAYTAHQYNAYWSPDNVPPGQSVPSEEVVIHTPNHRFFDRNQSLWDTYDKMVSVGFEMRNVVGRFE